MTRRRIAPTQGKRANTPQKPRKSPTRATAPAQTPPGESSKSHACDAPHPDLEIRCSQWRTWPCRSTHWGERIEGDRAVRYTWPVTAAPTVRVGEHAAERRRPRWTADPTEFVALAGRSLPDLLAALDPGTRRVFLVDGRPCGADVDGFRAWTMNMPAGWRADGHHTADLSRPALRYVGPEGRRVRVLLSSAWHGRTDLSPRVEAACWAACEQLVRDAFDAGAALLDSPATTGRSLMERAFPAGATFPTLPDDLAALIRSTSGQGRTEVVHDGRPVDALYVYDARFAYAALCAELPSGPVEHHRCEHPHGPYARARLRCTWRVPEAWRHVGLLPAMSDGPERWAWARQPGELATGWVDGVEVRLARAHGWHVEVHESLVWPTKAKPLDRWADALRRARERAVEHPHGEVLRSMLRSIVLHGIGALHARSHRVTKSRRRSDIGPDWQLPDGAGDVDMSDEWIVWTEPAPLRWPAMARPEWSSHVWARARVRLLDSPTGAPNRRAGALHVDAGEVLGFRTDAVYLRSDPGWVDDGAIGRLRREVGGPLDAAAPAPARAWELVTMRERVSRG